MNFRTLSTRPVFVAAAGGFLGLALRALLYRIGFDDRGILSSSHPLHLTCLVLAAAMILFLALKSRELPEYPDDLSRPRFLLSLAAGCFLLLQGISMYRLNSDMNHLLAGSLPLVPRISGILPLIRCILTALAGIAMVICGLPEEKSRSVSAFCHGAACVVFAADMLGRYQSWSGNPQLPDYVFHVLAGVALSLSAYQTLALHTGLGKPRIHRFWCLTALFLCILCLSGPEPRAFYLSGACWALFCLTSPMPPQEPEEETSDVSA